MSTCVTVTLPDDVYRAAERLAQLTSRDVADVLVDALTLALPPLNSSAASVRSVEQLSDEEVMTLTELQMEPEQDRRLSALLQRQQAGELSDAERPELLALMQSYQEALF
jgi:predicted transcriptional regulator